MEIPARLTSPASNVTVQGIHFEYSNWLDPSYEGYRAMQDGLILQGTYQAPFRYVAGESSSRFDVTQGDAKVLAQQMMQAVPEAAVNVYDGYNIGITNDTFEHLGGAGLMVYGGLTKPNTPSNDNIQGNTFSDIADAGIIVNGPALAASRMRIASASMT